jgi:hypothetical protein
MLNKDSTENISFVTNLPDCLTCFQKIKQHVFQPFQPLLLLLQLFSLLVAIFLLLFQHVPLLFHLLQLDPSLFSHLSFIFFACFSPDTILSTISIHLLTSDYKLVYFLFISFFSSIFFYHRVDSEFCSGIATHDQLNMQSHNLWHPANLIVKTNNWANHTIANLVLPPYQIIGQICILR